MTDMGRAAIEQAKSNGMWAVDAPMPSRMDPDLIPVELENAFSKLSKKDQKKARSTWSSDVTPGQRKNFLFWLTQAKRAETRENRASRIVSTLLLGITKFLEMPKAIADE